MHLRFQVTVIPELSLEIEVRKKITSKKYVLCPQLRLLLQSKPSNEAAHLSNSRLSESGPVMVKTFVEVNII